MSLPMSKLTTHARDWEEMARLDPLWAILSAPEKRYGQWQLEDFLRTGDEEITALMTSAKALGLPRGRAHAVDFGCGVGRLTRALRPHFSSCHGIDISSKMLEMARELTPECDFRQGNDLSSFPDGSADFIYSTLVLQHQPSEADAARLIADMVRILAPGGLLVFQMPIHLRFRNRLQLRRRAYRVLRALGVGDGFAYRTLKLSPIRMVALSETEVGNIVKRGGASIVKVEHTTPGAEPFVSGIYFCTK